MEGRKERKDERMKEGCKRGEIEMEGRRKGGKRKRMKEKKGKKKE
jgi:hypothetical protein